MNRPTMVTRLGGMIVLLAVLCTMTPGMASTVSAKTLPPESKYCVAVIAPRTAEDKAAGRSSRIERQDRFATQEEKESVLTAWFGPQSLRNTYLLIRFWQDADAVGAPLEIFSDSGCAGDYGTNLGDYGWDEVASSAEPHCGRTMNLWEHPNQGGASLYLGSYISNFGALNDEISSWDTAN